MKSASLRRLLTLVMLITSLTAVPQAHATWPTLDAIANSLHLKDIGIKLEELRTKILNLAAVRQILTINKQFTDIQKGVSNTIGSVRKGLETVRRVASKVMGTINYWKNFDAKKLIPFFNENVFSSVRAFKDMKNEFKGLGRTMESMKSIRPGSPYQYATLEAYHSQDWLLELIDDGQRAAEQAAEIGDERYRIAFLDTINDKVGAAADMAGRGTQVLNNILMKTIDEGRNMAIINNARREARRHGNSQIFMEELGSY